MKAKVFFSREITPEKVVALYNYMSQILVELIKLANLIRATRTSSVPTSGGPSSTS